MHFVTGAAGFIGYHACRALLERGDSVLGIDNFTPYYDPALKRKRIELLSKYEHFEFLEIDIAERKVVESLFARHRPSRVLHLAAQPGVRYSLVNPYAYIEANIDGFMNVLEGCRHNGCEHLAFASSSSVYGANSHQPFSEHDNVDHPVSLYAATKKANELMAHTYAHLYRLPVTGLRFFTVYGPWGRPDMAIFLFTRDILAGKPIQVFNNGNMIRDFTYIDDIVEGSLRVLDRPARYAVYNIGNHQPVALLDYIALMEAALGKKARLEMKPMQPGDVKATYADTTALAQAVGFAPATPLAAGLERFAAWFKRYYGYG